MSRTFLNGITDPRSAGVGKVLTSDASGNAAWLALVAASASTAGTMSAADFTDLKQQELNTFRPGNYGTLDPTGATSSNAAFAAMVTAVNAANTRCRVEMPPGVFLVNSGTLNFSALTSPFSIYGQGREATVLLCANTTGDMLTLPSTDGCRVHDFAIYQSGTPNTAGSGINVNACDDVDIRGMFFVNQFVDINIGGSAFKVSVQSTRHSQTNGSATSVGILVNNGAVGDTYIGPDVVMSNTGATRRLASVQLISSGHFEVNQCNLTGSQYGIIIQPTAGLIVADGFLNEVLCDSNTVAGMLLSAVTSTSTIKSIKSVNSWYCGTVAGTGTAGVVTAGAAGGIINGVTHVNDRFLNNQTHGYQYDFGTDFRWMGCDFRGNSAVGFGANDGLHVAAAVSNWSVVGGKSGGTDGAPTGGNQRYGVNVAPGASTQVKVLGVDLTGNSTGSVFTAGLTGLATVRDNLGPVSPRLPNTAATAIPLTTITNMDSLGGLPFPASARAGTTVRATVFITSAATAQTLTARILFGPNNTNADTQVASAAFGAGTAVVGSAILVCTFTLIDATHALAGLILTNAGTTGVTNAAVQVQGSAGLITVATAAAQFLGVYGSSATASALTVRSVIWEVVAQ